MDSLFAGAPKRAHLGDLYPYYNNMHSCIIYKKYSKKVVQLPSNDHLYMFR